MDTPILQLQMKFQNASSSHSNICQHERNSHCDPDELMVMTGSVITLINSSISATYQSCSLVIVYQRKSAPESIDVKKVFYVFYYFYKKRVFRFFIFWNVFYFLVKNLLSY